MPNMDSSKEAKKARRQRFKMKQKRKSLRRSSTDMPGPLKARYMKKLNTNRRVPAWVIQRTNRRVMRHPKTRNWRRNSLKL